MATLTGGQAADRPTEPLDGKSSTACWKAVLDRINMEINRRRHEGEDLPAPARTAIAGPEYFGLNIPDTVDGLEHLDPEHCCAKYWAVSSIARTVDCGFVDCGNSARQLPIRNRKFR